MKMMKKFLTRVLSTTILTAKDYERKLCSMNFKIGETFKIKDVELLTLDIIDGNPFVIALDTGIESKFAEDSNNYDGSTLEDVVDEWFEELGVPAFSRVLDLTTMDGSKCYGALEVEAAPLTFDEFRKYAEIIIPNIKIQHHKILFPYTFTANKNPGTIGIIAIICLIISIHNAITKTTILIPSLLFSFVIFHLLTNLYDTSLLYTLYLLHLQVPQPYGLTRLHQKFS